MEAASFGRDSIPCCLASKARGRRAHGWSALSFLTALLHLLLAVAPCPAQATDVAFTPKLTQYSHRTWGVQDGTLPGVPISITQTADGYLWIGTESGLVRFDGIHFTPEERETAAVNALAASRDGGLWVGTSEGLKRLDGTGLKDITNGHVNALAVDNADRLWVARTRTKTPLCEVTSVHSRCYGLADGLACVYGQYVFAHSDGSIWLGDGRNLCRIDKPGIRIPLPGAEKPGSSELVGGPFVVGARGEILQTMTHTQSAALQAYRGGAWSPIPIPELGQVSGVEALLRAKDGSLWLGTDAHGIYHLSDARVDHLGTAEGLSGDSVTDLFEDREGSIWAVTSGGIDRLSLPKALTFSTHDGLLSDVVRSVITTSNGDLLAGTSAGLSRMHAGVFTAWTTSSGLPGTDVSSISVDSHGTVWLGVSTDLVRFRNNRFNVVRTEDGSSAGRVTAIVEDTEGSIWVTTASAPHARLWQLLSDGKLFEEPLPGHEVVKGVAPSRDGGLWTTTIDGRLYRFDGHSFSFVSSQPVAGNKSAIQADTDSVLITTGQGLLRWDGTRWSRLSSANGLPCDNTSQFAISPQGDWWLALSCGDVFVPRTEVERWKRQPSAQLTVEAYRLRDGARPLRTSFTPAIAIGIGGRAWFATETGLQLIDRDHLPAAPPPPPVHLTAVFADHKSVALTSDVRVAPLTRNVQITFDGLGYLSPEEVAFKYRLSGFDKDWQDAGNRHEAFYMNLPPGKYVFQVIARNREGVWNDVGDSMRLTLPPAFYQTALFRAIVVLMVVFAGATLVRLRIRRAVNLLNTRHGERLAERDRIARELHDTLLQGFQMLLFRMHTGVQLISPEHPARPILEDALDRAERVLVEGRNSVKDLRGERTEGRTLPEEFARVLADYRTDTAPLCAVSITGTARELNSEAQDEILAIGREALLNALRHARAANIRLELRYDKRCFSLACSDDGRGMTAVEQQRARATGHFGLVGMRERATKMGAKLTVNPGIPSGTVVQLRVPGWVAYRRTCRYPAFLQSRSNALEKLST